MILISNNLQIRKVIFFNEKETIAWAINTNKSQSVLFCQPIVLVARFTGFHYQNKLWREWPFSYEDFERVAHGLDISMENFN